MRLDLALTSRMIGGSVLPWLFAILSAVGTDLHAASFDCGKVLTRAEMIVCSRPQLSELDVELAGVYRATMISGRGNDQTRSAQQRWLLEARNQCEHEACLFAAYRQRIRELTLALSTDVKTGGVAPSDTLANTATTEQGFSPREALPRFTKAESYDLVRDALLAANWQPHPSRESSGCPVGDERCDGRPETEFCGIAPASPCKFLWKRDDATLAICTVGTIPQFDSVCDVALGTVNTRMESAPPVVAQREAPSVTTRDAVAGTVESQSFRARIRAALFDWLAWIAIVILSLKGFLAFIGAIVAIIVAGSMFSRRRRLVVFSDVGEAIFTATLPLIAGSGLLVSIFLDSPYFDIFYLFVLVAIISGIVWLSAHSNTGVGAITFSVAVKVALCLLVLPLMIISVGVSQKPSRRDFESDHEYGRRVAESSAEGALVEGTMWTGLALLGFHFVQTDQSKRR